MRIIEAEMSKACVYFFHCKKVIFPIGTITPRSFGGGILLQVINGIANQVEMPHSVHGEIDIQQTADFFLVGCTDESGFKKDLPIFQIIFQLKRQVMGNFEKAFIIYGGPLNIWKFAKAIHAGQQGDFIACLDLSRKIEASHPGYSQVDD